MAVPKFNWEALRGFLQFYEKERLRYFPLIWGQKKPVVKWEPLQNRAPTFAELAEWFQESKATGVGIICGGASNGLVALCFNAPDGASKFFGQKLWDRLLGSTFVVKTPRGVHVYLRSSSPIPSQFVARGDNRSWLEIRADGNYIAAPPSLHPSGVLYEAIGVEHIVSPGNLTTYIEQRLTELGLKARLTQEAPKGEPAPAEEAEGPDDEVAAGKLLECCAFIQYCKDTAVTLPEPFWWSMIHCFAVFDEPGRKKIHELSQAYPSYSKEETDKKIEEAIKVADKDVGPHTCLFIEQSLGFACPKDCQAKKLKVKAPAGLANKLVRVAGLPIIIATNRFLKEKTADTIEAIKLANIPPRIFERSGYLVRISQDEFGSPYIETLTESACRGFIERAASFFRVNDKGKTIPLPAPPLDIVRDFMSLPHRNLPTLLGITEIPVLRSDGSILIQPGYDEITHLYYQPAAELTIPTIPDSPNQEQLKAAVTLLKEPLTDFPFDSEASRTNALAALLTPACRPMIPGLVPLCVLDKPQPGTGASLLSDVIAIITTGKPAVMMAPPKSDEECEKRLGSILLHGQTVVIIDNIEGYLYFPSLAMLLTADTFLTRILGQSKMVLLPNRCSYIVTGNNVKLGGDMPRRCYLSRMDAREARPWMRDPKSFKYQHLTQWAKEHRGELLAAILTMARAWIAAGKPIPGGLPILGSFEGWTNTVGGILTYAGLTDFLGNLTFMYLKSDVETPQWENFLEAWIEIFGEEATTTAKIIEAINEHDILAGALPDTIDRDPKKFTRSLGSALSKRTGVRYSNGLMITKRDKPVHHAIAWQAVHYQQKQEIDMEV